MNIGTTLPARLRNTHDPVTAFSQLVGAAKRFGEWWEPSWTRRLAVAAVAFTAQVAVEYGYDVETIRAMERDLIARLESEP